MPPVSRTLLTRALADNPVLPVAWNPDRLLVLDHPDLPEVRAHVRNTGAGLATGVAREDRKVDPVRPTDMPTLALALRNLAARVSDMSFDPDPDLWRVIDDTRDAALFEALTEGRALPPEGTHVRIFVDRTTVPGSMRWPEQWSSGTSRAVLPCARRRAPEGYLQGEGR